MNAVSPTTMVVAMCTLWAAWVAVLFGPLLSVVICSTSYAGASLCLLSDSGKKEAHVKEAHPQGSPFANFANQAQYFSFVLTWPMIATVLNPLLIIVFLCSLSWLAVVLWSVADMLGVLELCAPSHIFAS